MWLEEDETVGVDEEVVGKEVDGMVGVDEEVAIGPEEATTPRKLPAER